MWGVGMWGCGEMGDYLRRLKLSLPHKYTEWWTWRLCEELQILMLEPGGV